MKNKKTTNSSGIKLRKIITAAVFTALTCVATMVIRVPSPVNGYLNFGDCFVLAAGFALSPVYGALSAGLGSALADILSGYAYYAPGTFFIKAGMALVCFFIYKALSLRTKKPIKTISRSAAAICAEIVMIAGYFGYAALLLGNGISAAAGIPGNAIQGVVGIIGGVLISGALDRILPRSGFGNKTV